MNHPFAEHLPWRVASLAGLLVGSISLAAGVSVWTCLLRVGAAFVVFGLLGLIVRFALQQGETSVASRGTHFDRTTPDEPEGETAASDVGEAKSDTVK